MIAHQHLSSFVVVQINIQVGIQCLYKNNAGDFMNCIDASTTNRPFINMSPSDCTTNNNRHVDANIVYRICNDNSISFTPNAAENKISFSGTTIHPINWDDPLHANSCRQHKISRRLNLCDLVENEDRNISIEMDGNLANSPTSCPCSLTKPSRVNFL